MRTLLFFFALLFALPAHAQTKPNILLIMVDDAAAVDLAGLPLTKARVADQGAVIKNFVTTTPLCAPSIVSILRGQYPHNTGILTNADSSKFYTYRYNPATHSVVSQTTIEADTIATRLTAAGYRVGNIGKYANGFGSANITGATPPKPPGYSVHMSTVMSNTPEPWSTFQVVKNGSVVNVFTADNPSYEPYEVLKHSVSFLRTTLPTQPFFLRVQFRSPHTPSTPHADDVNAPLPGLPYPPSFAQPALPPEIIAWQEAQGFIEPSTGRMTQSWIDYVKPMRDQRYRSMLYTDRAIMVLLDELEASGKLDNTFVIVTSDNGWMQGEHSMPGGKAVAYAESFSAPLWIRGPFVNVGHVDERLAASHDLAPTFLRMAGLSAPAWMDGRQLHPLFYGNFAVTWRTGVLGQNWDLFRWDAIQTDRWKMVLWYQSYYLELYDLLNDPYEMNNVAYDAANLELRNQLQLRIIALRNCAGAAECKAAED